MYKLLLSVSCVLFIQTAFSQSYEGKIEYDKKKQKAFVIEFSYPSEAVENAFIQKMEDIGYKGKEEKGIFNKDKGFIVFKNAYVTDISKNSMDYIVKVEKKSRKESDESVLYLVIMNNEENAMEKFDAADIRQAKAFLNNLLPGVESANLELQIKDQEDMVAKSEKKLRTLQSDKEDMDNKIKKLQQDIEDNKKDQDVTQKDIDNQKAILSNLKLKRKPAGIN
jgi:hypothetical protein